MGNIVNATELGQSRLCKRVGNARFSIPKAKCLLSRRAFL